MPTERRAHARVAVPLSVQLLHGGREEEFTVRDISRTGLFLYSSQPPGEVGAVVSMKLSLTAGIRPITIEGEIVRVVKSENGDGGTVGFGVRFRPMSPAQEDGLLDLIDRSMLGKGTRVRAFPRVYHVLEVGCRSSRDFRAVLRDIGEGGLGLWVSSPLSIGEECTVELARPDGPALSLRGWVVSCEPTRGKSDYRVGLRFIRMPYATQRELQTFLRSLYRHGKAGRASGNHG